MSVSIASESENAFGGGPLPQSSVSNTNSNFTPNQLDLGLVVNDPPDSMIQPDDQKAPLDSQRDYSERREETMDDEERVYNPSRGSEPQVKFNLVNNDDLDRGRGDSSNITTLDSSSDDDYDHDSHRRTSRHSSSSSSSSKYSNRYRDRSSDDEDYERSDSNTRRKEYLKLKTFCQKTGFDFPSHIHQDSPLSEIKAHRALLKSEKDMERSVEMCKKVLVGIIGVIEYTNNRFDPLGLRLDGWSEQIQSEGDEYDEVFEELYDKHQSKFDLPPEAKLMMLIAGSGAAYHVQNSMMSKRKQSMAYTPSSSSSYSQKQKQPQQPKQKPTISDPRYDEDKDIQDIIQSLQNQPSDTASQNSIGSSSSAIRSKRSNASVSLDEL